LTVGKFKEKFILLFKGEAIVSPLNNVKIKLRGIIYKENT
jgi:hypothetical protein